MTQTPESKRRSRAAIGSGCVIASATRRTSCVATPAIPRCARTDTRLSGALLSAALALPATALAQTSNGPSYVPMFTALLLVLALVPVALWLLKRLGAGRAGEIAGLKVVAQLALGTRERLVVVEAGERWLLLGVTANSINRVGTLAKGTAPDGSAGSTPFGALLQAARGKHESR